MRTYSPTQSTTYMVCPVKWWLAYKEGGAGLTVPMFSKRLIALVEGRAGHAALAAWYAKTADAEAAVGIAEQEIEKAFAAVQQSPIPVTADEWNIAEAVLNTQRRVAKWLRAYFPYYPTEAFKILDIEKHFTKPSNCYADLTIEDADSDLAIVDHKFVSEKARVEQLPSQYAMHYPTVHYCWAASEEYGRPCRRIILNVIRKMERFQPDRDLLRFTIEVPEHLMDIHKQQAERVWLNMQCAEESDFSGTKLVANEKLKVMYPNWEACDGRYGRCEFYNACHSGWEPNIMRQYIPKVKLTPQDGEEE